MIFRQLPQWFVGTAVGEPFLTTMFLPITAVPALFRLRVKVLPRATWWRRWQVRKVKCWASKVLCNCYNLLTVCAAGGLVHVCTPPLGQVILIWEIAVADPNPKC